MTAAAENVIFAICDKPYSVWGWGLAERNREFISRIDADYFPYFAERLAVDLEGDDRQRAALAIRNNYYLALETFFGLLCATLQAPDFVPGWILRATTNDIRKFISAISREHVQFPLKWESESRINFEHLSELIHTNAHWSKDKDDPTNENFCTLWTRLAHDFSDIYHIREYNSIKHGFRAKAGGFFMSAGIERERGVPCPPQEMKSLGGSVFGSRFYSVEPTSNDPRKSIDPHFTVRSNALNWFPEETALKSQLIATSISNLQSFLLIQNGTHFSKVRFHRPVDQAAFDNAWRSPQLLSSNFDTIVEERDIYRATKEEINQALQSFRR